MFIAFGCIITTLVVLAAPATQNTNTKAPPSSGGGGGCYGTKPQMEQAKKDYILRRFISYYSPVTNNLK